MKKNGQAQLRDQLLLGMASRPTVPADHEYFAVLRRQVLHTKLVVSPTPSDQGDYMRK